MIKNTNITSKNQELICFSRAKINLFLRVGARRSDGFHELASVFQCINLYDTLRCSLSSHWQLDCIGSQEITNDSSNLIVRAAQLLASDSGRPCVVSITLDKQIPLGAGLGGGSSNAATTLLALNRLWQLDYSVEQLQQLGARLGSDVPFFITGNNAFVCGRGERCIPVDIAPVWYVICLSGLFCSTAEVFSLHSRGERQLTSAAEWVGLPALDQSLPLQPAELTGYGNDLLPAVVHGFPAFRQLYESLSEVCEMHMSGSGSSLFSIAASRDEAESTAQQLQLVRQDCRFIVVQGTSHTNGGWY